MVMAMATTPKSCGRRIRARTSSVPRSMTRVIRRAPIIHDPPITVCRPSRTSATTASSFIYATSPYGFLLKRGNRQRCPVERTAVYLVIIGQKPLHMKYAGAIKRGGAQPVQLVRVAGDLAQG